MSAKQVEKPQQHSGYVFLEAPAEEFFTGFEPYFTFETFDVRRRRIESSGLFEYKARGTFPKTPCKTLLSVYMDFQYRQHWDPHMNAGELLKEEAGAASPSEVVKNLFSSSPDQAEPASPGDDSGVDVNGDAINRRLSTLKQLHLRPQFYHYAIKMPFPLTTRDYVYTMKSWAENSNLHLVEGSASSHLAKPEVKSAIRITDYYQQIAVKPTEDGLGAVLSMRYYDDPKGSIPTSVINFAAQKGVPSFVKSLSDACEKYESWLKANNVA
ncbi:hypothetical protein HDU76_011990 [Blyttiomyces sp. JEL0837]|nr:hypothetical protein HDU76_011990 [Blyttiomyces sp. JEL0837]